MSCGNSCNKKVVDCPKKEFNDNCGNNSNIGGNAFVIMIVLYILLAIIVGSYII